MVKRQLIVYFNVFNFLEVSLSKSQFSKFQFSRSQPVSEVLLRFQVLVLDLLVGRLLPENLGGLRGPLLKTLNLNSDQNVAIFPSMSQTGA